VGVLKPGGRFDLPPEALGADRLGTRSMERLESHRPVVSEVLSEVDHGRAATTEFALDQVALA
jgi:hypothetical protein